MDELRRWYRDGLPVRLEALDAERGALAQGDEEAPARLREIALALSASGAVLGVATAVKVSGAP